MVQGSPGANLATSFCQLAMVERGAMTRKGPGRRLTPTTWQKREMVCRVLPRPISSARMPLAPSFLRLASHLGTVKMMILQVLEMPPPEAGQLVVLHDTPGHEEGLAGG